MRRDARRPPSAAGFRITTLAASIPALRAVRLSRNFGKEGAISAGLEMARGRAVIVMDADLQHPPSAIPSMVRLWKEGHDVVEAVKAYLSGGGKLQWIAQVNCRLQPDMEKALDTAGKAQGSIVIPNSSALIGVRVYTAFVTIDPQAPYGIRSISGSETLAIIQ